MIRPWGKLTSVRDPSVLALGLVVAALACAPTSPADSGGASGASGTSNGGTAGAATLSPIGAETFQLLTVVSSDWSSVPAVLHRYQRSSNAGWDPVGEAIPVVLGKSGLGWGHGLQPATADGGPSKHEGDGRSPAGLFSLGTAFGYAPPDQATWISMPYLQATDDLECVDDPSSSYYNQLVYRSTVANVDWSSSEPMKLIDNAYRWGLFVDHNVKPTVPGDGSCIFLHVWSGPSGATAGCTATDETQLQSVIGWLDPAKHPVLVQLPAAVYAAHQADWLMP